MHFLAALAYRTQKALRGAPPAFAGFAAGNRARTPQELVRHMTSVLGYARTFFLGGTYRPDPLATLDDEVRALPRDGGGARGVCWRAARRCAASPRSSCCRGRSPMR